MSTQILIGINPVAGALEHDPANILEMWIEQDSKNPRLKTLVEQARRHGIKPQACSAETLNRLSEGERHQGVLTRYRVAPPRGEMDLSALIENAGQNALFLILDGVTDPHNFGACLRSAEAAGVTAVIVPKDRAVGVTSVVRRAAAGAADRVPIVTVTNLARTLKNLKDHGIWLTGLTGNSAQSFYSLDLTGPVALILGNEGDGLRRLTEESCDFLAKVPMQGKVESLNVSVATGVVLFEVLRQRKQAGVGA